MQEMNANRKAKIGLALGGGGVRGLAHLGVLQALEEAEIAIDMIAGTSMGGLVGGLYAAGVPLPRLNQVAAKMGIMDFASRDHKWRGLFQQTKLAAFLEELLGSADLTFADLQIPLTVTAADLERAELVLLREGPLIPALLATSAFPIVFSPVHHQGRWLVDGGVLNNFPVDVVRDMGADRVLGVNVPPDIRLSLDDPERARGLSGRALFSFTNHTWDWKQPFLIAETSASLTSQLVTRTRLSLSPPDVLIEVRFPNVGIFSAERNVDIIEAGRREALSQMPALVALKAAPLPPRWRCWLAGVRHRLVRAWVAFRGPVYPSYP
jgi:NTE family protein